MTDRGEGRSFKGTLVFTSGAPDQHHQLVIAGGRPKEATFSTVMQISFSVPSIQHLRDAWKAAAAQGGAAKDALKAEGAAFDEVAPQALCLRQPIVHMQARKADSPRLSACTCKVATTASRQGAFSCLGNLAGRSRDTQHEQVRVRGWLASP